MLIRLKIQNLILVTQADICFSSGLNIITGETGSGKSAILSAIRLISGERADTQLIGKNGDLAVVEAYLLKYTLPEEILQPLEGGPLIIRREIHRNGKSRCFIADHLVPLSLLREVIGNSIELIDQSSSHTLCLPEEQRRLLDTFAGTLQQAKELEISFLKQSKIETELNALEKASETRERDLKWTEEDLALIEEVQWKQQEEETLCAEHKLLIHSQEISKEIEQTSLLLGENSLKKAISLIDRCARIDKNLSPFILPLKGALLEIEECQRSLDSYLNRMETDPLRLKKVEERISSIEQIKRRFGKTFQQVEEKKQELQKKIEDLQQLEEKKERLQTTLKQTLSINETNAKNLSQKRKQAAHHFSSTALKELQSLNLSSAQFDISLSETLLKSHGCDSIDFLFSANAGHSPVPMEQCASGGELSRLLLALKITLANKENSHCLVFDEIDSNVGGNTASILGEKLKKIAAEKQVICVTHFVQVAKCANLHFSVTKQEENNQTYTNIALLTESQKMQEYQRMLGESLV
jgi:DNA repair protein RecN (Recombination protein N)